MAKYGNKSSITPKSPNDNKLGFKGLDDFNLN
jgi:hypothetical protein